MSGKARTLNLPNTLIGRLFANLVWLLGGKGFGAVCSLIYLAILTRSLGLKDFGHFSLIFGTSQALIAIAGFQTWRVVVRYGATHVHTKDWTALGRLGMLAGTIEVAGAIMGGMIAYLVFYQLADVLDLNRELIDIAFWFNVVAVWALVSTPTGIVRALDRFDVAVYVEALVPLGRLTAAAAIWITGPSLTKFLIAWLVIDLLEAAIYWVMAKVLCPEAVRLRHLGGWRKAFQENPGVGRFFLITYAGTSLDAGMRHGPLLAVGFFVGTSAAGLYRLAHQLAQGLSKFSTLLTRATYAEIARARVVAAVADFRNLVLQTTRLAGAASAVVVALAVLGGGHLLVLLGGEDFREAYAILTPLTIAACFELASVAFEPVLHATGRARYALVARLIAVCAVGAGVLFLVGPFAAEGAAWAVAFGGLVSYVAMGLMARHTLKRLGKEAETSAG